MELEEWSAKVHEAAARHEAGDLAAADAAWQELIPLTPTAVDRSVLLVNRARTLTLLGRVPEAEASFDAAIAAEEPLLRGFARGHKAAWLAEQGRTGESIAMFKALAAEPWTSWSEGVGYEGNLEVLRSR